MRIKAIFYTLFFLICSLSIVQAQVPQNIPYQAVVRVNGDLLIKQNLDFRLTILRGGATIVYQETQSVSTNDYGLVTFNIGGGNIIVGQLDTISWQSGNFNLKVEVNNNGGWVNMGTTRMRSVPYALYANRAVRADSVELNLGDLLDVVAPAPANGEILRYDSVSGFWVNSPDMGGGGNFVAGTGINVSGDTIYNTGDLNPNDVQIGDTAAGDLGGFYPNPEVRGLGGSPISSTPPQDGFVLKWNDSTQMWVPGIDATVANMGATTNTSAPITGDGSPTEPVTLGQNDATVGQVLKWDGSVWTSENDSTNEYILDLNGDVLSILQLPDSSVVNSVNLPSANLIDGPGILISNGIITNTGDTLASDDITINTNAGGDLGGQYPSPTVVGIQGIPVLPSSGVQADNILKFVNGQWSYEPDEVDDNDADPNNELQTLQVDPINFQITIGPNGNTQNLPQYIAGPGISINGTIISNTGDIIEGDDIKIGTTAGGDLSGTYPSPVVTGIHGFPITPLPPSNGSIYTFDSSQPGWVLNTVDTDSTDDIQIGTNAGGDLANTYPNPEVAGLRGFPINPSQPGSNQVLKFINGAWTPTDDEFEDADKDPQNEIQDLILNGSELSLSLSGGGSVVLYTAGNGIDVVGNQISVANNVIVNGTTAGGDLSGTYPNPNVVRLQGEPISSQTPQFGEVLKYINGFWIPTQDNVNDGDIDNTNELQTISQIGNELTLSNGGGTTTLFQAGQGISLSGNAINNTGDLNPLDDVLIGSNAGGDLGGTYPNPIVTRIQTNPISNVNPVNNYVLKFLNGQWTPAPDIFEDGDTSSVNEIQQLSQVGNQLNLTNGGNTITMFTAGAGIDLNGNQIINTGDTVANDDINIGTFATGDLSGTYPGPTVSGISGFPIASGNPSNGQFYKYNNGQWVLSSDLFRDGDTLSTNELQQLTRIGNQLTLSQGGNTVTMFVEGAGIDVINNQIINTGDTVANDDINIGTIAGGDLGGTYPDPMVTGFLDVPLASLNPDSGDVYKFINGQWVPSDDEFEDGDTNPTNEIQTLSQTGSQLSLTNGGGSVTLFTEGAGIDIIGNQIINTGDTLAGDDITTATTAGGDLAGFYPNPTVDALQGQAVSTTIPTAGYVLKFVNGQWTPAIDLFEDGDTEDTNELQTLAVSGDSLTISLTGTTVPLPVYVEGAGIDITNKVVTNTGDLNAGDDVLIGSTAGGDLGGTYPNPIVDALQGRAVSTSVPLSGEVLKWSGTEWEPAPDSGSTYVAGGGIDITGNQISNTGDTDASDDITNTTSAGGDLSGTYPNPLVGSLQGRTLSGAAPSTGEVLKWSGTEWEPAADSGSTYVAGGGIDITGNQISNTGDTNASDDITNTTTAGGDLAGTYPNPIVDALQGRTVSSSAPSTGEILKWSGTEWEPAADSGSTYVAGGGIDITGNQISNTGDTDASDDITNTTTAGGDLAGTYPNPTVDALQGRTVSTSAPSTGEVLKWSGTEWEPAADSGSTYIAGGGIDITGNQISNTGDTDASDDITNTTTAGGDLAGTYPNPTVDALQGRAVSTSAPSTGEILKWSGTEWEPAADSGSTYIAGGGIDITGNQISNTGDTDASDDITNTTTAGGDLAGTYPNPTVDALQGRTVSTSAPSTGEVLKWSGTEWEPAADSGSTYIAGGGIDITGNQISNTGDTDASDDITNTTTAGGDLSGTYPNPTVDALQGRSVSSSVPSTGEILKWTGTEWEPRVDSTTTYVAGGGIDITGNQISNTGDTDGSDDITNTTTAGGDLSGTYPNPLVGSLQGRTLSGAAPSTGEVLKWSGTEWEPAADSGSTYIAGGGIDITGNQISNTGDTDASDDITNTTTAGGDLSGTYPNPLVGSLQGRTLSGAAPSTGEVLKWSGTEWEPAADSGSTYIAGGGIDITGNQISNTGDTDASDDITNTTTAGGDLAGTYPNPTVNALQGRAVSTSAPSTGEILKWSGTEWEPAADSGSTYIAGGGIDITGNQISNTGDTDASDDITTSTSAGGDLNGTYPNPTVDALQGRAISTATPATGEVLKWSGTEWEPAADSGTTYTAGAGISIVGTQISNTGDTDASDDITNTTTAGGDLSGTYPNPTVNALQGRAVSTSVPSSGEILKWSGTEWEPGSDSTTTYTAGSGISIVGTQISNTGDPDGSDDITTSTTAGGDLNGIYPNPTVDAIQGQAISTAIPGTGEVLKWSGTEWEPTEDSTVSYTAGSGISIVGDQISNTGDTDGSDDITTSTAAGGDLTGTYPNPTVNAIQGQAVSTAVPATGEILKWSGTEWEPTEDSTVSYTAGSGISIVGDQISNTGDTDGSDDITTSTSAGGDLSGTYPNPTVDAIQGQAISTATPASGEILKWSGTEWEPGSDSTTTYTAGGGISIVGTQITNTGDTDGSDDITTSTAAGGDLNGTYPNPTVDALQGRAISTATPASGEVLKWSGTEWEPAADSGTTYTAGGGISIVGTQISNTGDTDASDDITNTTTAGGDLNGTYPNPTVDALQGRAISSATPSSGEILKWSGTEWEPAADSGSTYTAGGGISIVGNQISNTGDTDGSDDITNTTAAGGDLNGTYPNPTVDALQGRAISTATPAISEVLTWSGTEWEPGTVNVDDADADPSNEIQTLSVTGSTLSLSGANSVNIPTYSGGTGISITGLTITNTGDTDDSDDITTSTSSGGDLNGLFPNPNVVGLQGFPVAGTTPSNTQVLKWTGATWTPSADSVIDDDADPTNEIQGLSLTGNKLSISGSTDSVTLGTVGAVYSAGPGIDINGSNAISNTGDRDSTDDITNTTVAGGDLSGLYPNPSVARIQNNPVVAGIPSTNDVLKWDGSQWDFDSDTDTDSSNELQSLSLTGITLSISDGNSVNLPYVGGAGIALSGATIINIGDTDASDDITTSTSAGGDLDGTYPNPTVDAIQGRDVVNVTPSTGEVLKWNGSQWEPLPDSGSTYSAGAGISIVGALITNTGDTDDSDDITTSTSAGGDLNGTYPNPDVVALRGNSLSTTSPSNEDILKWNSTTSEWTPGADSVNVYTSGGAGLTVSGLTITNTGDTDGTDDITNTTTANGDLSGTYPNPTVDGLQGRAVSSNLPLNNEILKWDDGISTWVPGNDSVNVYTAGAGVSITGLTITNTGDPDGSDDITNTTTANGDLSGTYPNPTVDGLQGRAVSSNLPLNNEILKWDDGISTWVPDNDSVNVYTAGAGVSITGLTITNTGDADGSDDITNTTTANGDLSGTYPNPTVDGIQGRAVSSNLPVDNEILKWDDGSSTWIPDNDSVNVYTAGAGVSITGLTITNTGDADGSDDITNTTTANGDLSGTYPNPTVDGIQGRAVSATLPVDNEILKWDDGTSTWVPDNDSVNVYTAGAGVSITGLTVTNTGDTDGSDDITNTTTANGDLDGTYPNPTVDGIQGRAVSANVPLDNEILKWDNGASTWVPDNDSVNVYTAGAGLSITGLAITNTGDTDGSDDITTSTVANGDLDGTYPNPTVDGIRGQGVLSTTPETAEVLRYDGTNWGPDTLSTGDLLADMSLIPDQDNTIDLGSSTNAWRDVFSFNTVTVTSDRREKEEIQPLTYGMEEIMQLNPVSYNWKRFPDKGRQLGLIAQEVAPVIEEVVSGTAISQQTASKVADKERLGITYGELIPVIIKGMQEQQQTVDRQQEIIQKQEAMIQALEARLQALEQQNK